MIRLVLLDVDGVLTDGRVWIDASGHETKSFHFRDLDAVHGMRREGRGLGLITGEDTPIVQRFRARFQPDYFYAGCLDKASALREIFSLSGVSAAETCYMGDGMFDLPVLGMVGFSACPSDAAGEVRARARWVLDTPGGHGCVWELWERIRAWEAGQPAKV